MELPLDHNERRVGGNCLDNVHRESAAEAVSNGLTPGTVAVSTTVSNKYTPEQRKSSTPMALPLFHLWYQRGRGCCFGDAGVSFFSVPWGL